MAARPRVGDDCSSCEFSMLSIVGRDADGNERDVAVRFCRRYPPAFVLLEGESMRSFPIVEDDEWCGEYVAAAHEPDVGAAR